MSPERGGKVLRTFRREHGEEEGRGGEERSRGGEEREKKKRKGSCKLDASALIIVP